MASSWRRLVCLRSGVWSLIFYSVYSHLKLVLAEEVDSCDSLRLGQYLCKDPKIDESTQEPENCRDVTAWVECLPAPNISCRLSNGTEFRFSGEEVGFNKTIPCRNVSGYSYKVAVALSLFLGWLGADRFYLGYPALGCQVFGWRTAAPRNTWPDLAPVSPDRAKLRRAEPSQIYILISQAGFVQELHGSDKIFSS
ncbi:TM2 domain-containing protein 1 isoform X2 [Trematomus bernacchii]|uniref:TM2 domain-containing protein 1 isoform X2 n=1 Tax=Trematomus bernacchii TaxID=40690 RepID=UPI00146ADE52|nr:TM2 domain-containing protein 1 isoform X2 [Trematomus bernacchii]